ncbi:MAG: sortase [Candidatus Saccharimonadales bacterium]
MQPTDNRQLTVTPRNQPLHRTDRDRAAEVMREQIDRIYDQPQKTPQTAAVNTNPYEHTHDNSEGHNASSAHWQRYHSAWQQYYQQYYERYYRAQHARVEQHKPIQATTTPAIIASTATETVSEDKAIDEIRNDLTSKIQQHSSKIRKSRHFVPIISALVVMSLFMFLQFNRVIIGQVKTFISPGSIAAQNIIVDPTLDTKVGAEPKMIIPKINVDAPVVYDVPSLAETTVQNALKNGIIHYPIPGANANPGEIGNAVFLGHSSNDVFDDGGYKFIFVQLEQMRKDDTFYIHYNGTRYTYTVTSTETILPTEVTKLIRPTEKPSVTLVTCTPVGTAEKRFLVHAEQISPDPSSATAATAQTNQESSQPRSITGNSPTLFDRLFGF